MKLSRFGCCAIIFTIAHSLTSGNLASAAVLIQTNASWKYLADGSDQGTAWQQRGFNDASWPSGAAQLGFGDGDEATIISTRPITVYFRREIVLPAGLSNVPLRLRRDDGAICYVKGVGPRRDNMPAGSIT